MQVPRGAGTVLATRLAGAVFVLRKLKLCRFLEELELC